MCNTDYRSILEELAENAMMISVDDKESIRDVQGLLGQLAACITSDNSLISLDTLNQCQLVCSQLVAEESENPQDLMDKLLWCIKALDESNGHNRDAGGNEATGRDVLVLSDWVDETVFKDFLANQQHVLEDIEGDILSIENGSTDVLSSVQRRIHTLKGESGVLGLTDLEEVCHGLEDFLEKETSVQSCIDQLLFAKDWIASAIESYAQMRLPSQRGRDVLQGLANIETEAAAGAGQDVNDEQESVSSKQPSSEFTAVSSPSVLDDLNADESMEEDGVTSFLCDEETLELLAEFIQETEEGLSKADEILISIETDGVLGESVNGLFRVFHTIKGVAGFLELTDIMKLAHITETMLNQVRQGEKQLEGPILDLVFDSTAMVRQMLGGVRNSVTSGEGLQVPEDYPDLISRLETIIVGGTVEEEILPEANEGDKLGEILSRAPMSIAPDIINEALEKQKENKNPLGKELIASDAVSPKQVAQALRSQKRAATPIAEGGTKTGKIRETVKVDLERVDSLVEMIGELVIVESMVVHSPEITGITSPKVRNYLGQLAKITRDLQDVGMRMRMVPVRGVFQKMSRMVRDLSRKSAKQIRLVQSGEGTEMDRSMVEQISDPLVHMIRNAVDHGVELPEERTAAGKPAEGTIRLSAYHEGGSLVIELADDGRGLNKEAILAKAIKQGIVTEGDNLSEAEIHNLIFAPGFSTAKKVTDISGRGVGMDVVKKNIDAMRGRVHITSTTGQGSVFKIILPLTLAIIDGMLVACGEEQYIVPTLSIMESIQVHPDMFVTFAESGELINVRGEIMPFLRLSSLFDVDGAQEDPQKGIVVVVEGVGQRVGLFVDEVLTQQQVVIKSLGDALRDTQFVSGAAILSDGRVGLIINIEQIGELVEGYGKHQRRSTLPQFTGDEMAPVINA